MVLGIIFSGIVTLSVATRIFMESKELSGKF